LSDEEGDKLKKKLVDEVLSGRDYDEVLKEGQLELFEILKEKSEY
jgi:energy-converting hydrogenase A subunit M